MFAPDLFSNPEPAWQLVADARTDEVISRFEAGWENLGAVTDRPLQIGGIELNSNNYRLETTTGSYVMKRWPAVRQTAAVHNTCGLLRRLANQGLPVAPPLALDSDAMTLVVNDENWAVFRFRTGQHFQGNHEELTSAGRETGRLFKALGSIDGGTFTEGPQLLTDAQDQVMAYAIERRSEWPVVFGEAAPLLLERSEEIESTWRRLRESPPVAGTAQLCHYDLHPHNLLMLDGVVATVLDFDACGVQSPGYGTGFAMLKLTRQAMVGRDKAEKASGLGQLFLASLLETFPELEHLSDGLGDCARAEVLRRILIILRLNLEEGNDRWNAVLPVQIGHLAEIDQIFS